VAIGRAIVREPNVFLFDEQTLIVEIDKDASVDFKQPLALSLVVEKCHLLNAQGAGHSDFTRVLTKAYPSTQFLLYHISEEQIEAMALAAEVIDNVDIAKQAERLLFHC
jgi:hypothetical protein